MTRRAIGPQGSVPDDAIIDGGIAWAVEVLQEAGVETFESCESGAGHVFSEPTVRFHGERAEGFRALAAAMQHGLPVVELRRVWSINDGELTGPWWELTFTPTRPRRRRRRKRDEYAAGLPDDGREHGDDE